MNSFRSLRWKIQFWQFCLMSLAVLILLGGFYLYEKRFQIERVDLELSLPQPALISAYIVLPQAEAEASDLGRNPQRSDEDTPKLNKRAPSVGPEGARSRNRSRNRGEENKASSMFETQDVTDILNGRRLYAKVWNRQDRVLFAHGPTEIDLLDPPREHATLRGRTFRWNGSNRELVFVGRKGELMIIGREGVSIDRELTEFAWKLLGIGAGILGLAFWLGWLSSGKVIRPIEQISRTAHRIAGGDLSERIEKSDTDHELDELVRVLNATFARLAESLERQIRFSVDASHELRTPLAIILNECQWVMEKSRSPAEYRTSAVLCENMARHMRGLIEGLLELSRADDTASPLRLKSVPLSVILEDARGLLEGLANQQNVELEVFPIDVMLMVDPGKVKQVIINLVNNAMQYSLVGGRVRVEAHLEAQEVAIDVIDKGVGIAAEELDQIFSRFYRVDSSRSRLQGGSGLGLAISLAIARAHGGGLRVKSTKGKGSCFTLYLPLRSESDAIDG